MSSTRDKVLRTLLTRQRCTINDLAGAVGINPISVRHHVTKLEATGFVASEEEHHGVGRPRRVYYLTNEGMEQFPTRYLQLSIRLLQQLKKTLPEPMIGKIFSQVADDLVADYTTELDLDHLPLEERLDVVKDLLTAEGFTMEWEKKDDKYYIREVSCPYYHVGQMHPEICVVDQVLISSVLDVPVEKLKCILNGDDVCTYVIHASQVPEGES
jgi:DeoR family suf operon transcriptional repressor